MNDIAIKDEAEARQGWPFVIYKTLKAFGV